MKLFYRCGDYKNVDNSCIMVPDPKDPTCCKMPECPLIPPGGTTPAGPTIIRPPQPTAVITNFPTPGPQLPVTQSPPLGPDGHTLAPPLGSTKAPTPRTGEFTEFLPLSMSSFGFGFSAVSVACGKYLK